MIDLIKFFPSRFCKVHAFSLQRNFKDPKDRLVTSMSCFIQFHRIYSGFKQCLKLFVALGGEDQGLGVPVVSMPISSTKIG